MRGYLLASLWSLCITPPLFASAEGATSQPSSAAATETDASSQPTANLLETSGFAHAKAEPQNQVTAVPLWQRVHLHAGINARTDPGVHPLRLDAGAQWGAVDAVLVLDPMFWTDGQVSTDLLLQWRTDLGIAAILGWRLTTIPLLQGAQIQQNLIIGAAADLPNFFTSSLRGQAGIELASTIIKHGGGLPNEVISFASARHFVDLVNMALFVRYEFALGL